MKLGNDVSLKWRMLSRLVVYLVVNLRLPCSGLKSSYRPRLNHNKARAINTPLYVLRAAKNLLNLQALPRNLEYLPIAQCERFLLALWGCLKQYAFSSASFTRHSCDSL